MVRATDVAPRHEPVCAADGDNWPCDSAPEPTPGLREAHEARVADATARVLDALTNEGWVADDEDVAYNLRVAEYIARAALAASPAPEPDEKPFDRTERFDRTWWHYADDCPVPPVPPAAPEPTGLDAAWAEAEAAMPGLEVGRLRMLRLPTHREPIWQAEGLLPTGGVASGEGPTPAAALRALAARLTDSKDGAS